jgi:pimeloyl-ACP methyl ester carboxylesterase
MPDPLVDSIATRTDAARLALAAQRKETACAEGTMAWRIWGEGEPVVLLHGGAGSWNHWVRNIAPLVNAGRMVLVPDLPGFGESAQPDGNDADCMPPWLEQGLQALVGAKPCDFVGFSFGALVCGFLAVSHPRRVRRFVLSGAPGLSAETVRTFPLRSWHRVPMGPERDAVLRHNLRALMLAHDESIDELALALQNANVVRDRMRRRRLMRTDALARLLPQIECPVAGIWGAEDALYRTRLPLIERVLSQARNFRSLVLIPDAGHWVQYERAAEYNAALRKALS